MRIRKVELLRVALDLVAPFRTSFGTEYVKEALLVRVVSDDAEGWGECVADREPRYSAEYLDGATHMLRKFFVPALTANGDVSMWDVGRRLAVFKGHPMAKSAIEMAIVDAELRAMGVSLSGFLGSVRRQVDTGVSVGIMDSIGALLGTVEGYLAQGYRRIKLKIEPGWDLDPVKAIRDRFGDVPLQVDANTAYRLADARHLAKLDDFDLVLVEQPLPEDDLIGHAELARRIATPICLDESITSARAAAAAISLKAASIINIKPGRVGGYLEARRIHDLCQANGLAVWCGGMLETGIGRAANIALAGLPNFTLPGDISASDRYFASDITAPFVLENGTVSVPDGPGIGVAPVPERLRECLVDSEWVSVEGLGTQNSIIM